MLTPTGNEAVVVLLCLRGQLGFSISPAVLAEYEEVLHRPHLKLNGKEIETTLRNIRQAGRLVHPTVTLKVSGHEEDNRFYECADAAQADYIVTGNTKHFKNPHKNIQIVSAPQLVELLARDQE
jgi:uncharacterized protein